MNKILNSPLRGQIDMLLLNGKTVYEVESWCRQNGLQVSATSINRYADNYLPDWKGKKTISILPAPQVREETAKDESPLKIELPKADSPQRFNQIMSDNLKESIINMVTIVNRKVAEYASGNAKLPKDEIVALEKVIGIFNQITLKHNEERAGKNIFDIDEALEQDEKRISSAGLTLKDYLKTLETSLEE